MRLKYAFSLVTAAALLAACDSTVTNTNDDAKAEGNITIMVVDNHSGAALSGATVYSVTDDKAVVGDSLGRSVWKKRALGDHSFQVSKDGYATVRTQVGGVANAFYGYKTLGVFSTTAEAQAASAAAAGADISSIIS